VKLLLNTVGTSYLLREKSTVQTSDKMKTTYGNEARTANAKVNNWKTVRRNTQYQGAMQSSMTTGHSDGGGNQRDS
jgi:hypothetical protein